MFIRDVFLTLSTEVITVGGNFLIGILLARTLSVTDRGIVVMVMTLPWLIMSFANLGLPQANIYLVGREKRDPEILWANSVVNALIMGLLVVLIRSVAKNILLRTALKGLPGGYWWLLMLLIPPLLVDTMTLSILLARQTFSLYNLRKLLVPVVTLIGFAFVLLVLRSGLTGVVSANVIITILMALISLALTRRQLRLKLQFDPQLTGEAIRFGLKSYLQNLVGTLNYRIDVYLLAFLLTPREVAFYGVATSLAEVAWYIPNSVGTVLFPRLSHAPLEQVHQITAKVCRNTLAISGCVVIGMLAVGWAMVPLLYGQAYRAAVPPLLILLPGVISMSAYKVLTRNFTSRNRQQVSILAASVALTLNVGLDWILIPRWGVVGAATASTAGYTTAGGILLIFFLRDSGLSWQEALVPKWHELIGHWSWAKASLQSQIGRRRDSRDVL